MSNTETGPLTPTAFRLLQEIVRAYRGDYALGLGSTSLDDTLGELWDAGMIEAAPIASCHDRFIPTDLASDTFDVVDAATGSIYGLEPRNADRFILRLATA